MPCILVVNQKHPGLRVILVIKLTFLLYWGHVKVETVWLGFPYVNKSQNLDACFIHTWQMMTSFGQSSLCVKVFRENI